jgi:hypothetical protein
MSESAFKYDVAFSFLSGDLAFAEQLARALTPELSTFVYSRFKEELLGGDGMDQFAQVFGEEARLTVILHRDGWGETKWTAFEESHIKDRALNSRMRSFIVVCLDKADLPAWVPESHQYLSINNESHDEMLTIIRYRARQEGAVLRKLTVAEAVLEQKRLGDAREEREQRRESAQGLREVQEQVEYLFAEMDRHVAEVTASDPNIRAEFGAIANECAIASPQFSTSVNWLQPYGNTLRLARLRINDWRGRVRVPKGLTQTAGPGWKGASHFVPELSDSRGWVWKRAPELDDGGRESGLVFFGLGDNKDYSTPALAEHLVLRHFKYAIGEASEQ